MRPVRFKRIGSGRFFSFFQELLQQIQKIGLYLQYNNKQHSDDKFSLLVVLCVWREGRGGRGRKKEGNR